MFRKCFERNWYETWYTQIVEPKYDILKVLKGSYCQGKQEKIRDYFEVLKKVREIREHFL